MAAGEDAKRRVIEGGAVPAEKGPAGDADPAAAGERAEEILSALAPNG